MMPLWAPLASGSGGRHPSRPEHESEVKMNKLDEIRRRLEEERAALMARLEVLEKTPRPGSTIARADSLDLAMDTSDQLRRWALHSRSQQLLEQIDAALQRIDAGTYGKCQVCGRPIAPDRLDVLPYAALCVRCSARQAPERQGGSAGTP